MELRKLEQLTKEALLEENSLQEGEEKFAEYIVARKNIIIEILDQIKAVQPNLTDHSSKHVADVLDNAEQLLGEHISDFSGTELYCLILAILFHDVGNIFEREEHQRNVAEVYDFIRSQNNRNKQEKYIVLKVAEAHCGQTTDGSIDTLKSVEETAPLWRTPVRLRYIAAILRFADELAEGPHRTSNFMQKHQKYSENSEIYHEYANITNIFIDRGNNRIAITYDIEIETDDNGSISHEKEQKLHDLLDFSYQRIKKINQERQYSKHYCEYLSHFKETTVAFRFWINGEKKELGLNKVSLTDLVLPGAYQKEFWEYNEEYVLDNVMSKIKQCVQSSDLFCVEDVCKIEKKGFFSNLFSRFSK